MPLFTCDVATCPSVAVRDKACLLCERHLCAEHLKPIVHRCPDWRIEEQSDAWYDANNDATRDEVNRLITTVNIEALCARASSLKNDMACSASVLVGDFERLQEMMGGMNYHITITFVDGEEWICRIRRSNASSPPPGLQNRILVSEVATMQFLHSVHIPVPKVYGYATNEAGNPVGVGYILMEKLSGHALDLEGATAEQINRLLGQFADIFAKLACHPFPTIGCLEADLYGKETLSVGPLVPERTAAIENDELVVPGPFATALDYRSFVLQWHIALIKNREEFTDHAVDAYLLHRFLLDNVSSVTKADTEGSNQSFLKHMDDKGDHILVDDDFNIVGIIDWEWAQTVPMSEAFAAPLFMLDVAKYYGGDNALSEMEEMFVAILKEKGLTQLAGCVEKGRVQHRLAHCVGGDVGDPEFCNMLTGLLNLTDGGEVGEKAWKEWRAQALKTYADDAELQAIAKREA